MPVRANCCVARWLSRILWFHNSHYLPDFCPITLKNSQYCTIYLSSMSIYFNYLATFSASTNLSSLPSVRSIVQVKCPAARYSGRRLSALRSFISVSFSSTSPTATSCQAFVTYRSRASATIAFNFFPLASALTASSLCVSGDIRTWNRPEYSFSGAFPKSQ